MPVMPRSLLVGLVGVAVVYVGVCLALFLLQRSASSTSPGPAQRTGRRIR